MTTPVLTEDGKRLAEALRQARVLHSWNYVSTAALNAAAASLRLPLEGDGAGLREALKRYTSHDGTYVQIGMEMLLTLVAIARPQPEAKGPVAAGEGEITEADVRERARSLIDGSGWKPGDRMGLHSVFELMTKIGLDITRNPPDRCNHPDCGCDADAVCSDRLAATTPPAEAETPDVNADGLGDGRRICEALGFDPTNHHNALKCPYCNPKGLTFATPTGSAGQDDTGVREARARKAYEAYYRGTMARDYADLAPEYRQSWLDVADALAPQPPKAETLFFSKEGRDRLRSNLAAVDPFEIGALISDCDKLEAALSTAPAARPGDEVSGFVLVPREPTPDMDRAGAQTFGGQGDNADARYECAVMYRAMIAAAPAADGGRA